VAASIHQYLPVYTSIYQYLAVSTRSERGIAVISPLSSSRVNETIWDAAALSHVPLSETWYPPGISPQSMSPCLRLTAHWFLPFPAAASAPINPALSTGPSRAIDMCTEQIQVPQLTLQQSDSFRNMSWTGTPSSGLKSGHC